MSSESQRAFLIAQKETGRKELYKNSRASEKVDGSIVMNLICRHQDSVGKAWNPEPKDGEYRSISQKS